MPVHHEERVLPYTPAQVYALIADVERYPEFLPWCMGARINSREANVLNADLIIGYKALREKFTSIVTLSPNKKIDVQYGGGPLSHLKNEWTFAAVAKGQCKVTFMVDFDFKSRLLSGLINAFFDRAFLKMMNAFEKRAEDLYG